VPIGAVDLVSGGGPTAVQPALEAADRQALAAYRRRLAELDAEIEEASEWADLSRSAALEDEREALLSELAAAAGLRGRARGTGSTAERARVAATKAITTAVDRIAAVDTDLGRHLKETVQTGTECCYRPGDDAPAWRLG
jgi:hypothetical protein